jgi:hypothetical protein
MALVAVEVVNNSAQTVRLSLDEDGDTLAYLRKLVKREDLDSVKVLPAARKTAASK